MPSAVNPPTPSTVYLYVGGLTIGFHLETHPAASAIGTRVSPPEATPARPSSPRRRQRRPFLRMRTRGPGNRSPFPPLRGSSAPHGGHYSCLKATAGRTRAARRAGSQHAAIVTARVKRTTAATSGGRTRNGTELMK